MLDESSVPALPATDEAGLQPPPSSGQGNAPPVTGLGGALSEGEERKYCYCNGVSYGEMIGCDDPACEREWFHLYALVCVKGDAHAGVALVRDCRRRRTASGTA
jgi:hypothetical protein